MKLSARGLHWIVSALNSTWIQPGYNSASAGGFLSAALELFLSSIAAEIVNGIECEPWCARVSSHRRHSVL